MRNAYRKTVVKKKKKPLITGQTNVRIRSSNSHLFMGNIMLVGSLKQMGRMQL